MNDEFSNPVYQHSTNIVPTFTNIVPTFTNIYQHDVHFHGISWRTSPFPWVFTLFLPRFGPSNRPHQTWPAGDGPSSCLRAELLSMTNERDAAWARCEALESKLEIETCDMEVSYMGYIYMGMDQYLLIPFLGEWTSIYQLFWCSPGVQGFDTLPYGIYIYGIPSGYD